MSPSAELAGTRGREPQHGPRSRAHQHCSKPLFSALGSTCALLALCLAPKESPAFSTMQRPHVHLDIQRDNAPEGTPSQASPHHGGEAGTLETCCPLPVVPYPRQTSPGTLLPVLLPVTPLQPHPLCRTCIWPGIWGVSVAAGDGKQEAAM